jgi:hypothetical protein
MSGWLPSDAYVFDQYFHQHLIIYENRKICQCKACVSAIYLSLKIISHYGEFAFYNVKQFKILIGRDVIVAHQLLKTILRNMNIG